MNRGPRADLGDLQRVPLALRLVGQNERVFARRAGGVVPESSRALVGTEIPLSTFLGVVPDLNLGRCAEVDAAIPLGDGLIVDQEFDVAVVLVGGEISSQAVVDDFTFFDGPVFLGVGGPLGDLLGLVFGGELGQLARVEGLGEVVVGAALEARHPVVRATACRQHQHGCAFIFSSQFRED